MSKLHYRLNLDTDSDAFIEEFGDSLTDQQIDALDEERATPSKALLDPNDIDPRKDPVAARRVLCELRSTCTLSEEPFVLPLLEFLEAAGTAVPAEVNVLSRQRDLYLLRFALDAKPAVPETFTAVQLKLDYPRGNQTYQMTPDTELETRFEAQATATVGVDARAGFTAHEIGIPGVARAGASSDAALAGKLAASWEYSLVQARIVTNGIGSSFAEWIFHRPKRMVGSVPLAFIVTTPKGTPRLPIIVTGNVSIARGLWWWKREAQVEITSNEPLLVELGSGSGT